MELQMAKKPHHLVLIPGLDGTGRLFEPLMNALPADIDASVVSFPHDKALYDRELFAIIRNVIPWDRELVVLAESTSGPLGLRFADAQRENVSAVILASSFVSNPVEMTKNWATTFLSRPWYEKEATPASVKKHLLGKDAPPALVSETVDALQSVWPAVLARRIDLALKVDARHHLRNWHKPILYLKADQDGFVPSASVEEVVSLNSGVEVVSVPGPHLVLQANPRGSAAAIQAFLQKLPNSGSVDIAA